jgi:peptidoglycan/xylan/chitin deacetylase (PgdA/CDA1 family)
LDPAVTILAYHRIGIQQTDSGYLDSKIISATPSDFDWQISYLKRCFTVLSFEEFLEGNCKGNSLPPNTAIITFDDGYQDNYELAYPILQRYNLPATIFLITGVIGTSQMMWWDEVAGLIQKSKGNSITIQELGVLKLNSSEDRLRATEKLRRFLKTLPNEQVASALESLRQQLAFSAPPAPPKRAFLTWDEVKEMQKNNISFGAHTRSHPILTRIPIEQAKDEIEVSKSTIEQVTEKPVLTFAYPNGRPGDHNAQTRAILASLRFKAAVTLIHGSNSLVENQKSDWLALRRIYIGGEDRATFIAKVSGALEKLNQIRFTKKHIGAGD